MILQLGSVVKVFFTTDFNALDDVYQVTSVNNYQQVLDQSIDLFTQWYALVGKTEEVLVTDLVNYTQDQFFTLVSMNTQRTVTAPSAVILTVDVNIKKYYSTMMMVDLGIFEDPTWVEPITTVVINAIRDRLGNPNMTPEEIEAATTLDQLGTFIATLKVYDKKYLTNSEYLELANRRKLAQQRASELSGSDHYNYCTRYLQLLKEHQTTLAENEALKTTLIALKESL